MAYTEGQLSGDADFKVGINVWRISSNAAGNSSTFGWEVHLTTPQQYGTWDGSSDQTWRSVVAGVERSGTFRLTYENRFTEDVIVASGTQVVPHDGEGFLYGFPNGAYIGTNHGSVGSGWSGDAWADAPRIAKQPTTPRNLRVTATNPTSLSFAWDAPADNRGSAITGYLLRYSPTSPADGAPYTDVSTTGLSASVGNLTPGTVYFVTVYARNGATYTASGGYSAKHADIAPRTTSGAYVWNGSTWKSAEVFTWNGSAWRPAEVQTQTSNGWRAAG